MKKSNIMKALAIASIMLTILVMATFVGANQVQAAAGSSNLRASYIEIKIYFDSACKEQVTSLNWGAMNAGSNKSITIYVRNEGRANVRLALTSTNWNPANAPNYMKITWDYNSKQLTTSSTVKLTLTLATAQNTPTMTSFNCDIVISAISTKG